MTQDEPQPVEILNSLGINGTPTVTLAQGGYDMAIWKVEHESQTYALRLFHAGEHEHCEREQLVMAAARTAGLPVPEVHTVGVWQDRPVLLMTWMTGRVIVDELGIRPWNVWRIGIEFGCMQAKIHAVPAPDRLPQVSGDWITWKCGDEKTLHDHLRRLPASKTALLHLDYHPINVLTDGKRITGVIDWTNAHAGDPRADAARTVSILRVDPLARKPFTRWLGLHIFELAWRIGYQREHGRLHDMPLFYAWAGAVLLNDQFNRYKDDPQQLFPARRWTNKWKKRAMDQAS